MCFKFPDGRPTVTGIGDPILLQTYATPLPLALGWQCPGCGAVWAPAMPGCLRCNGRGNRAANPLVDIVISPPAPEER
jgi:hypothetical protein